MKAKTIALLFAALLAPGAAFAGEAAIRALFEGKLGSKIEQINKAPIGGLYEVVVEGQVMYVNDAATYFIAGNLVDAKTMRNMTAEKKAALSEKKLGQLPYENAVKHVNGNGEKILVTFEDPNCGYCKKLWREELMQIDNLTIYTFLIPIIGGDDSAAKNRAIWCADDRAKSWSNWITGGIIPVAAVGKVCDANAVLDKNVKLSRSLGVSGTPFMYFPATRKISKGYISAAEIEKNLVKGG